MPKSTVGSRCLETVRVLVLSHSFAPCYLRLAPTKTQMARGRPFPRSLNALVRHGVMPRPPWMAVVEAIPPHFELNQNRRPPVLTYPEDRLRAKFLEKNPEFRSYPLDLKAKKKADAHIADRLVAIQLRAMTEQNMSESQAYEHAMKVAAEGLQRSTRQAQEIGRIVSRTSEEDQAAQLFLTSLKDSMGDLELHNALRSEKTHAVASDSAKQPESNSSQ